MEQIISNNSWTKESAYARNRETGDVYLITQIYEDKVDLHRYGQKYQNIPTKDEFFANYETVAEDALNYVMDATVNHYYPIRGEAVYYRFVDVFPGENKKRGADANGWTRCKVTNVYWKSGRLCFDLECVYGPSGKYLDIVCGCTAPSLRPAIIDTIGN